MWPPHEACIHMQFKFINSMITVTCVLCIPACILRTLFEVSLPYSCTHIWYGFKCNVFESCLASLSNQLVLCHFTRERSHVQYTVLMASRRGNIVLITGLLWVKSTSTRGNLYGTDVFLLGFQPISTTNSWVAGNLRHRVAYVTSL